MNAENIQQKQIYNEYIQEFFPLFDKAKKEDDPIYNARVSFNMVKFLIEHPNWNEDENKNKAYEFILQECGKTKKVRKRVEREAQKRLNDYIEGGVKENGIKIYGNHVSVNLENDKREFKISEFLNSDFCKKNGISGFSTLHSDGKSGMHGFVAKEEGRKVRHYTITDGSYEMKLNWYVNGKKCTIKINIDKDGVDLVEDNGVTNTQLQANKDVKIGGLFLHQIQFRKKGRGQANGIQRDSQSFETVTRVSRSDVVVQATYTNRGVGSQATIPQSDRESDLGYKIQEESSQNKKRTTPTPTPRTSSLKKDAFDKKRNGASTTSMDQNQDSRQKDGRYNNPTFTTFGYTAFGGKETTAEEESIQAKNSAPVQPIHDVALEKVVGTFKFEGTKEPVNTRDKPLLDDVASILAKRAEAEFLFSEYFDNGINSQEAKEERERRHVARKEESSECQIYNLHSLFEVSSQNEKTSPSALPRTSSLMKGVSDEQRDSIRHVNQGQNKLSYNASDMAQKQFMGNVLEKTERGSQCNPIRNRLKDKIEGKKKDNHSLDTIERKLYQKSDQGNVIEKRENDDGKPSSSFQTSADENIYVGDTQLQKGFYRSGLKPEDGRNFQKVNEVLEKRRKKRRNAKRSGSNHSSTNQNSDVQFQVDTKQLKKNLMNAGKSNDTLLTEFTSKLDKETKKFPLRPVDQKEISEQHTRDRLIADKLMKYNSPKGVKKVAGRLENTVTNLTIDKNSNLHRLLEKDIAQLKLRVIEEERNSTLVWQTNSHDRNRIALGNKSRKLLWAKRVAESQEEKGKRYFQCRLK